MSVKHIRRANSHTKRGWRELVKNQLSLFLLASSVIVPFAGCTAFTGLNNTWKYNGYWNQTMMGHRNRTSASKAWHSRKHHFCNEKYMREFSQGFKAGYMEVADGGTGCTPSFPPREYWGWKYQSCEGQARVAAWYSGFPHGARAAEEDGIGNWTQIQTSSTIQQQYAQHGLLNASSSGMYPVAQSAVPNGRPQATVSMPGLSTEDYSGEKSYMGDTTGIPVSIEQGPAEIIYSPQ